MVVWNAPTVAVGWVIMKTTLKHKIRGWGEWKALLILVTLSWSEATRDGATVPICEYEIIRPNPEYVFIHSLHSRWKATFIQHITYCLTRPFEGKSWVTVSLVKVALSVGLAATSFIGKDTSDRSASSVTGLLDQWRGRY